MLVPSSRVLDLFAVPETVSVVPGGATDGLLVAGDLVLAPHQDPTVTSSLAPHLARLAVQLDERPDRRPRDLRLAMPVPARDGSWVVDGWAANRWEPGSRACDDVAVVRSAGRLLHAILAGRRLVDPTDLAARSDAQTILEAEVLDSRDHPVADLPHQLVHRRLWGRVLFDPTGAPVVSHLDPGWRPVAWADALAVVDAAALGPDAIALDDEARGTGPTAWRHLVHTALEVRHRGREHAAYASLLECWNSVDA